MSYANVSYNQTLEGSREARRRAAARRRHRALVRRNMILSLCASLFVLSFAVFGTVRANASSQPVHKYYTVVEVQEGDTLWDLATRYIADSGVDKQDYLKEIKKLNNIPHGQIYAGDCLTMIYYSTEMK